MFPLYVLVIGGSGDYGTVAADGYGLDKIFNRWFHHRVTHREGEDWYVVACKTLNFSSEADRDSAKALYSLIENYCVDYDFSKNQDAYLFTENDVWGSCELSDADDEDDEDDSYDDEDNSSNDPEPDDKV